jgi:hypothetical protein
MTRLAQESPIFAAQKYDASMLTSFASEVDFYSELQPENPLEFELLSIPAFQEGLMWGAPRYGHPEGEVYKHVIEVLENIDRLTLSADDRYRLRLIAYAHDTFKNIEHKGSPRDWTKHHSVLARHFLENYCDDQVILDITELHDEAYYSWRMEHLYHQHEQGQERFQKLLRRIEGNIQLYYLFFKCDTRTGDKTQAPVKWFEQTIKQIEIVDLW